MPLVANSSCPAASFYRADFIFSIYQTAWDCGMFGVKNRKRGKKSNYFLNHLYDGGLCPLSLAYLSLQAFWGSGVNHLPLSCVPFLTGFAVFFLSPEESGFLLRGGSKAGQEHRVLLASAGVVALPRGQVVSPEVFARLALLALVSLVWLFTLQKVLHTTFLLHSQSVGKPNSKISF